MLSHLSTFPPIFFLRFAHFPLISHLRIFAQLPNDQYVNYQNMPQNQLTNRHVDGQNQNTQIPGNTGNSQQFQEVPRNVTNIGQITELQQSINEMIQEIRNTLQKPNNAPSAL